MKRIKFILFLSALLTFFAVGCGKSTEAWLEEGRQYFDQGEYARAIEAYEAALKQEPENKEAYYYLSASYMIQGDMETYKEILLRAYEQTEDTEYLEELEFWEAQSEGFYSDYKTNASGVSFQLVTDIFDDDLDSTIHGYEAGFMTEDSVYYFPVSAEAFAPLDIAAWDGTVAPDEEFASEYFWPEENADGMYYAYIELVFANPEHTRASYSELPITGYSVNLIANMLKVTTPEGIGLQNTCEEVTACYGEPDIILYSDLDYYLYLSGDCSHYLMFSFANAEHCEAFGIEAGEMFSMDAGIALDGMIPTCPSIGSLEDILRPD